MGKEDENKFLELYSKLPVSIQDFLASDKIGVIIEDALNLGKVSSEKFSDVMDILTEVLFLQLHKEQFKNELEKRLNIPPISAEIIDKIINNKIFEQFSTELEQYKYSETKKPIEFREPLETPEAETIKTEEIKELIQKQKPLEIGKTEVITKEEIPPDLSQPEIQEIKIERPINRTGELKRVTIPSASPEAQEKIHSKLMEAMNKKEVKPKIVEEMKKVVIEGIKKTPQQKPKPKTTSETEESITSQVIGGEGKQFIPQEKAPKSSLEKPYIFDVRLKEEEEEEKKEALPKGEIKYQRPSDKPFGEA